MKVLPLSPPDKGFFALVDDRDYEWASHHRWFASASKQRCGRINHYATRRVGGRCGKTIFLHREVITAPRWTFVDHVSGLGLDCRGENLRLATSSQNHMNRRKSRGTSRFKGVSWSAKIGRWQCHVTLNDKQINLGLFDDAAAARLFGDFARPNFPAVPA